jgi:hypothetical protein
LFCGCLWREAAGTREEKTIGVWLLLLWYYRRGAFEVQLCCLCVSLLSEGRVGLLRKVEATIIMPRSLSALCCVVRL